MKTKKRKKLCKRVTQVKWIINNLREKQGIWFYYDNDP